MKNCNLSRRVLPFLCFLFFSLISFAQELADPVYGCTYPNMYNYNSSANVDDGSCYAYVFGCMDSEAYNFNDYDYDGEPNEILGVDGVDVNTEDGSCIAKVFGCLEESACNFNSQANTNNQSCIYSTELDACASCSGETDGTGTIVDNDLDNDGVCNADELLGCTDATACNYDATPTTDTDNNLCIYSIDLDACATCSGETNGSGTIVDNDLDDDGVCNDDEVVGCQDNTACNYMALAN